MTAYEILEETQTSPPTTKQVSFAATNVPSSQSRFGQNPKYKLLSSQISIAHGELAFRQFRDMHYFRLRWCCEPNFEWWSKNSMIFRISRVCSVLLISWRISWISTYGLSLRYIRSCRKHGKRADTISVLQTASSTAIGISCLFTSPLWTSWEPIKTTKIRKIEETTAKLSCKSQESGAGTRIQTHAFANKTTRHFYLTTKTFNSNETKRNRMRFEPPKWPLHKPTWSNNVGILLHVAVGRWVAQRSQTCKLANQRGRNCRPLHEICGYKMSNPRPREETT